MRPNVNFYSKKLNDFIKETENIADAMDPFYQQVKKSLETKENLLAEDLVKVKTNFQEGVAKYSALLEDMNQVKAPAKSMGMHKKLISVFKKYIEDCQKMVDAISETQVNEELFLASEQAQDVTSDDLAKCLQRLIGSL